MHRLSQFWPSMRANQSAHRWVAPAPTHQLHVFPRLHGVVPEHAPLALRNRWMRPHPAICAQDDPLAMSSRVVIAEPHQQLCITVHQPAFPSWLRWGFMSGAIAIRHRWSLALIRFAPRPRRPQANEFLRYQLLTVNPCLITPGGCPTILSRCLCLGSNPHNWDQLELPFFIDLFTL